MMDQTEKPSFTKAVVNFSVFFKKKTKWRFENDEWKWLMYT